MHLVEATGDYLYNRKGTKYKIKKLISIHRYFSIDIKIKMCKLHNWTKFSAFNSIFFYLLHFILIYRKSSYSYQIPGHSPGIARRHHAILSFVLTIFLFVCSWRPHIIWFRPFDKDKWPTVAYTKKMPIHKLVYLTQLSFSHLTQQQCVMLNMVTCWEIFWS